MTIAPIVRTVTVKIAPDRAFHLFATQMGHWWPRGRTVGSAPHVDIVVEPHPGGRWYERDADGQETPWGKVLAWEPPRRLLLAWQLDSRFRFDPDLLTEVELRFAPAKGGGTLVTLEHRDLERFGRDAASHADKLGGGWPIFLGHYADHAAAAM